MFSCFLFYSNNIKQPPPPFYVLDGNNKKNKKKSKEENEIYPITLQQQKEWGRKICKNKYLFI